jgi:YidC/Oxa1 family membrane protein insertase
MAVDTASAVTDTAAAAAAVDAPPDYGWFGFLTVPIEGLLQIIHSLIAATGTANAWGVSIIVLTLLIKAVTFPLTKTQLESTNKMQAMQPAIKEIQLKYQSNPEVMNQKIAEFYQVNEINPLAGCLPSLVQIPVFIGLYRAVLELAKQNKLNEQFLFLPNLEGPTYGADPATASDWILKGWYVALSISLYFLPGTLLAQLFVFSSRTVVFIVYRVDGTPSLGWDDTLAFLVLPAFLVVSQFVSMELMQPKSTDPQQQQSNAILKVLPLMIGWFSLSVPAALSVYWVTNNIVTTASTLWIRSTMPPPVPKTGTATGGASAATMSTPQSIFTPIREKPAGFGETVSKISTDGVKPITVMDAEMVEDDDDDDDDEEHDGNDSSRQTTETKKKRRKGSKKKGK